MRRLARWLTERDDIAVFSHRAPDGDAIGSAVAAVLALRALGKRAAAFLPGGAPDYLAFLPGLEDIVADGDGPFVPKCAFAVDVSSPEMLGINEARFFAIPERAVLDHHESNPLFGDLNIVCPECSATGEMMLDLIRALDVELTADIATNLLAAISSDTGHFNYSNTTPAALEAAAACVRAGADIDRITREIYRTRSFARTKLLGLSLAGAESDGRVAFARATNDMFAATGAARSDTERIVNYLIEIDGVQIAVLATEQPDGQSAKISLRSAAPYNVARDVAVPLGGGGHERAAGITIRLPIEQALQAVLDRIREIL